RRRSRAAAGSIWIWVVGSSTVGMIEAAARSLLEILEEVRAALAGGASVVEIRALDPDRGRGCYPGERVDGGVHRPYRVWLPPPQRAPPAPPRPPARRGGAAGAGAGAG